MKNSRKCQTQQQMTHFLSLRSWSVFVGYGWQQQVTFPLVSVQISAEVLLRPISRLRPTVHHKLELQSCKSKQ